LFFAKMLKKVILLIFISALYQSSFAQQEDSFSIVGSWQVVSEENDKFVFDSLGFVSIYDNEDKTGGDSFVMNGDLLSMTYELKDSLNPKVIILKLFNCKTLEVEHQLMGIYAFIDENTLRLYFNTDEEIQPKKFDEYDTRILKRIN